MAGVLFVVCVPTANFEHTLIHGSPPSEGYGSENLIKLDVELRSKNEKVPPTNKTRQYRRPEIKSQRINSALVEEHIPMEKILDELLNKLEVEHVVWCGDKMGNYYEVFFPLPSGDPCENCLHCLTELGIGTKLNSVVSVLPCSVVYSGMDNYNLEYDEFTAEQKNSWDNFVESVRSKLTVKQVVEGVRSGGNLTFDYVMLVVTADCLAALGLVENNASNVVAAMLVSPLMGPVMSITFGTIIADRSLQKCGFKSLFLGILISLVFGFIFGLILGTTEMPWGFGDWPTEEMKARGNVRSLWMGVLWALPSGTGVALALLQGSAGPLIGVAISASLLPPVVNCGLYWALACIWKIYKGTKIPHLKGEPYTGNSSYVPIYTEHIPAEFIISGIVSGCLTLVNVICIFITAVIVLKIKEVAAPYTSTPDLRKFWEHDIRAARHDNRSTMRAAEEQERMEYMHELNVPKDKLSDALEAAVREAIDDDTYKKVKRLSYAQQAPEEVAQNFLTVPTTSNPQPLRNSALTDLAALDKLITSLLNNQARSSPILNRFHPLSRSWRRGSPSQGSIRRSNSIIGSTLGLPTIVEGSNRKNNNTRIGSGRDSSGSSGVRGLIEAFSGNAKVSPSEDNLAKEELNMLTKNTK